MSYKTHNQNFESNSFVQTSAQILRQNPFRLSVRQPAGSCPKRQAQSLDLIAKNRTGKKCVEYQKGYEIVFDTMRDYDTDKIESVFCLDCNSPVKDCLAYKIKLHPVLRNNCEVLARLENTTICEQVYYQNERIKENKNTFQNPQFKAPTKDELLFSDVCTAIRNLQAKQKTENNKSRKLELRKAEIRLQRLQKHLLKRITAPKEKTYIDLSKIESLQKELETEPSKRKRYKIQKTIDFLLRMSAKVNC